VITADTLIEEYVALQKEKAGVENKQLALEKNIAAFAKKQKIKIINGEDYKLLITQKKKTVFPLKNDAEREKLERLLAESSDRLKFLDYDVVRLATAYDANKLSPQLQSALKPLARKKPYLRITLLDR
jgi:hypothetical protein